MKISFAEQRSLSVTGILLRTTATHRPAAATVRVLLRFLVAMCCVAGHSATVCPSVCDCKWKDGKESVICVNTNLTRVPQRLDSSVLVLHLHGNALLTLRDDVFQSAGLLNLQKLYLVRCAVKYIEPHAFRALNNLVDLDLSYNAFSVVPSLALLPLPDLRELRLNGNPILQIAAFAFAAVGQLIRLEAADCRIGYVDRDAFSGLEHSLETLKLSRNRLTEVRPEAFGRLQALNGLDLSENPLNCSCVLQPLRDWMLRRSLSTNAWPVCEAPAHNRNKSWDRLQSDDFACVPSAHAAASTVNAYVGENATLTCEIGGTPTPQVRWTLRNRVLLNSTFGYPITNKRPYLIHALSDSYSNLTILSLEMQDTGQYVCIAENKAGKVIAEIELTIEKSPMGPIVSERVVLIGILLVTVLIVFLCSIILFIRVMYCKHDTQADIESKRRIISEKIEMKRNSANLKRSSSVVPNAKTESNPSSKKLSDSLFNRPNDDLDYEASKPVENDVQKPLRPKDFKENIKSKGNVEQKSPSSSIFESHIGEIALQHHVLHKKELPSGKLYTTAMAFMTDDTMMNYENGTENSAYAKKKTHYNTMPKNLSSSNRVRRNMSGYPRVSESQSPLLRDKYYGSSSESVHSNLERISRTDYSHAGTGPPKAVRRSKEGYWAYPSLPSSPDRDRYWTYAGAAAGSHNASVQETPLLNGVSRKSKSEAPHHVNYAAYSPPASRAAANALAIEQSLASTTYDYHAAQLERFLDEYRRLHSELTKMKETCERFGSRAGSGLDLRPVGLDDAVAGLSARYPSLRHRLHRRSKSSLSERAYDSRGSLQRSLSAKSRRSFERPLHSKSCSFERSVSFVPASASSLLKESGAKASAASADDVVVPKSILKKKNDGDGYQYGGRAAAFERRAYRAGPYASTLPLKRTRVRRFSDSSMEGFFD